MSSQPQPAIEEITIKRSDGYWAVVVNMGAHKRLVALPWRDTASCVSVVTWLRGKMEHPIKVIVDLS